MLRVLLAVSYGSSGQKQVQLRAFSHHAHCLDETILGQEAINLRTQGLR